MGDVRLREVSVSGGSTLFNELKSVLFDYTPIGHGLHHDHNIVKVAVNSLAIG